MRDLITSDPDIFRAVKLVFDQHGKGASIRAVERAAQLLAEGDKGEPSAA